MKYIHELPKWPEFAWDMQMLAEVLAAVRHRQGRHLGKMESLGFDLQNEAHLATLTREIITSSAIEGERLNTDEVRSSIARKLSLDFAGLPRPGRRVDGIVDMMLDATRNRDQPLTAERLGAWHSALFLSGRSGLARITVGAWRRDESGPMQVVSGPLGREKVHFQAPAAGRIETEMGTFLEWFNRNSDIDPVLKAAVSHFWFVTIHPFDDGNGRIARAISELALSRADRSGNRFYSMSSRIEAERKDYYRQLERAQKGSLDITPWIAWFLGCLDRALEAADITLDSVLNKARTWQKIDGTGPVNQRQRLVINRMLGDWQGNLNTSRYAKLARCSTDTALRDIRELLDRSILEKNDGQGRSTSYRLIAVRAKRATDINT
ncbi:MAG: Fic family protein [Candidatus Wallbacteria bacterium]|nr:Fic family protein [Candidatus Wallbacteria bacterium]